MVLVLVLSLAASVCFAAAYVLQYHEAHEAPRGLFLSPRLLVELAHHRIWLGGVAAMIVGDGLQAWALGRGSLAVVEPVLTSSLLFALPLSAVWRREHLKPVEWLGALMVSAGVALMLGIGAPTAGSSDMPALHWILVAATCGGFAVLLTLGGLRSRWPSTRAALIGGAAGVLFGLQDALTRYCLHWLSADFGHLVASWQPYVLVVVAVYGLTLTQSAYEAGALSAGLPPMVIGEPVIGSLIGILALNEQLSTSPSALAWETIGALVMVGGTWLLARSPLVLGKAHPSRLRQLEDKLLHHHHDDEPTPTSSPRPADRP